MKLDRTVSVLGLYEYGNPHPGNALFSRFYSVATDMLHSFGIQPTFIGAEGNGYSGKFTKFGGRTQAKLLQSGFSDISVLTLAANPASSDAPSYDSFACLSLSYVDTSTELLLCVAMNEAFVKLGSERFDAAAGSLARLHHWDFGFGFSDDAAAQPELHILGMDNGRLCPEDQSLLTAWYEAAADVRVGHLRDVYPYNLLNEQQLQQEVAAGVRLKEFIEQQPGCTLAPLADGGLYEWKVSDDKVLDQLRKQLRALPILIH